MRNFKLLTTIGCAVLVLAFTLPGLAQGGHTGGHHHPDSLTIVTVSGTAIVDSSMMHPMYYLDEDGDQQADYHLNFGPYWYQPDSGNASRPQDGDPITITGGMPDTTGMILPVIVVYEINGEFWRDPYDPLWNSMGHHQHGGGHHQGGCNGWGFGWMHDSLQVDTLSGTTFVDTTFFFEHYYLDESGNGEPDYFLNFGPYWYEPPSGATRPNHGDPITIVGGVLNRSTLPMVVVFEINGLVWRDTTQFGPHFGGGWIYANMNTSKQIHAPFDLGDWMNVNPGWHQGGGGGHHGMMPDTLFCQILELFPQNIPNAGNQNIFAGYEMGMFAHDSSNMMWQGGCGGHTMFGSNAQFQLHYNEIQIQGFNIDENTVKAKFWDSHSNSWIDASGIVDPVNNTVTFSASEISNFVVLTGTQMTTGISESERLITDGFSLKQNYPNPFNPITTIEFELKEERAHVTLSVYNALGQKILTLLDQPMTSGVHQQTFDGNNLPSGIYFYQLKVDGRSQVKRMELLK